MEILLSGILFVAGFVFVLGNLLRRMEPDGKVIPVCVVVFVIYSCAFGVLAALAMAVGDVGVVLLAIMGFIVAAELFYLAAFVTNGASGANGRAALLLTLYCLAVLWMTVFCRERRSAVVIQTDLMRPFVEIAKHGDPADLYHMILNIVLFAPMGFLLCRVHPKELGKPLQVFAAGITLSVMIEALQMILRRGNCDVVDILANALGALTGLFAAKIWAARTEE